MMHVDRQQIEMYDLMATIYIGHIVLSFTFTKDTHRMSTNKTKLISKPIGLKELRQLVKKKLGPSQISKVRVVSKCDLLRVVNADYNECQICYNPLVQPVTLSCGHSCCLECLEEGSLMGGRCSFYYRQQGNATLWGDHRKQYIQRQQELKIREKLRRVGDDIDYRDSYRMRWFKGSVMQVQKSKEQGLIYVEFAEEHKSSLDFEIYQSSSMNIAPAGYFSKRMVAVRPNQPRQQPNLRVNHSIRTQLSSNALHLHPLLSIN